VDLPSAPFILQVAVESDAELDHAGEIPAILALQEQPLVLHPRVTFLVGENGSGKSTLVEAIAGACDLNVEGGSRATRFANRASHSALNETLVLERGPTKPMNGFFLRAESFFNFATMSEATSGRLAMENIYERPLHEQSHGESFLALAFERFGPRGFYVLDEPEAALSLQGQLALMRRIHDLVRAHCQFVIATHSPILLGYPDGTIYELGPDGVTERGYEETEQFQLTRSFLENRDGFLRHLLADDD
jgi:predicted ATPase